MITRAYMFQLIRNDIILKEMGLNKSQIKSNLNQLIGTLQDVYGLCVGKEIPNNKSRGAYCYMYDKTELVEALKMYISKVNEYKKVTARKRIAISVLSTITFFD